MPLKFARNDITKMQTDAIVNTANSLPVVGVGTDTAVYEAAGREKLLAARKEIGLMEEGSVAVTPGFDLPARYIIHAVSPLYIDGKSGEEEKLRRCYRGALEIAEKKQLKSIAFPLIAAGNYGYPRDEALNIAMDELTRFLMHSDLMIWLVIFDADSVNLVEKIYPGLEDYISQYEVDLKTNTEYGKHHHVSEPISLTAEEYHEMETLLASDPPCFADYLQEKIKEKGLKNKDVYGDAYVTKQRFSKIITGNTHPSKQTALCLAVGAKMTFPEAVRLLSLAGYTFSDTDKTDIIFSYFIRHHRFDIYQIEAVLEDYGLTIKKRKED